MCFLLIICKIPKVKYDLWDFDFTYTADNKKLKIDYKINSVSAELDENGNLKVISDDATIVFFIEQSGDNTISGYYQYSLAEGAKRYPYNAIKLK